MPWLTLLGYVFRKVHTFIVALIMIFQSFRRYKNTFFLLLAAVMLNAALWSFLLYNVHSQSEPIFLHYNIFFGVDLIGPWYKIFFLPGFGLGVLLLNTFLAWYVFKRDQLLHYLVLSTTLLIQIILMIAGILIVFLNS